MSGALNALRSRLLQWAGDRGPLSQVPLQRRQDMYALLADSPQVLDSHAPERAFFMPYNRDFEYYQNSEPDKFRYPIGPRAEELMSALRNNGLLMRAERPKTPSYDGWKHYDAVGGEQVAALLQYKGNLRGSKANPWTLRLNSLQNAPRAGKFVPYDMFENLLDDPERLGALQKAALQGERGLLYRNAHEGRYIIGGRSLENALARKPNYYSLVREGDMRGLLNTSFAVPADSQFYASDMVLRATGGRV